MASSIQLNPRRSRASIDALGVVSESQRDQSAANGFAHLTTLVASQVFCMQVGFHMLALRVTGGPLGLLALGLGAGRVCDSLILAMGQSLHSFHFPFVTHKRTNQIRPVPSSA